MKPFPKYAVIALVALSGLAPVSQSAFASQADIDLIKSYVGEWRGRGNAMFAATGQNETVVCRMSIRDSGVDRIAFDGSCALAGRRLSVAGTVAYVAANQRYEAIMSSVASFQGVAIGQRRGDNIEFSLVDRNAERGEHRIEAGLALEGTEINFDFKITSVSTGHVTTAQIPFALQ